MTTFTVASDENFAKMTTLLFQGNTMKRGPYAIILGMYGKSMQYLVPQ